MAKLTPVENLDFFEVKESLKDYLKNQGQFLDYDFEGSNISTLVDLLAYNAFYTSYYYNMAIGENFLDSAQLRNSITSHAKELNYVPRSRRSSRARMNVVLTVADETSNFFTLPKNTPFNGKCGNRTYTFLTDKAYSAVRIAGTNDFLAEGVNAYEGRIIGEIYNIEDTLISNPFIDTTSLEVFVNEEPYRFSTDIFGIGAEDKVYYLQAEPDSRYSLQFGENVFGVQPDPQDDIRAVYRITSGAQANGVTSLTLAEGSLGAVRARVNLLENTKGGSFEEDIESIRKFAPKALQVQERAVTKGDYEILLKQRFNNIQAISVYGGDEVDPPQYGKVIISVDVAGGDGTSDFEIAAYREYLSTRTPLTIEPVFVPAKFMYVNAAINVVYNPNLTTKTAPQLRSEIVQRIKDYSDTNLNDFNITLRQSNLSAYIDDTDVSILGTDIVSKPIIKFVPTVNTVSNPSFSFETQLVKPYPLNLTTGFSNFTPTIESTTFTLEGSLVKLFDNGQGELIAVTAGTGAPNIFKNRVGTVDYTTGKIALSNFIVDDYAGDSIQFIARTVSKDITSPKDRILILNISDVSITVNPSTV